MDQEELLKLLQNDIDSLLGEDDQDGLDDFEQNFIEKLKSDAKQTTGTEATADKDDEVDWNELYASLKDVELQFDSAVQLVSSCSESVAANLKEPQIGINIEVTMTTFPLEWSATVGVDPEIQELMEEMISAVERSAPLVTESQLDNAPIETPAVVLPSEFIEFSLSQSDIDSATAEDYNSLVYDVFQQEDAQQTEISRQQMQREELRLSEIEREVQLELERELAARKERKRRREEELQRAVLEARKYRAATKIQSTARRKRAYRLVQNLRQQQAMLEEERRLYLFEQERLRLQEQQRVEMELKQQQLDLANAARELQQMATEDEIGKLVRQLRLLAAETSLMHEEDTLAEQLRDDMKEYDAIVLQRKEQQRDDILVVSMRKEALVAACASRAQEYRSIWNPADVSRQSRQGNNNGNNKALGWGGAVGGLSASVVVSNKCASNTNTATSMNGLTVTSLTEEAQGSLSQPLSLIQAQWNDLITQAAAAVRRGIWLLPSSAPFHALMAMQTQVTNGLSRTPTKMDPISSALISWLHYSAGVTTTSPPQLLLSEPPMADKVTRRTQAQCDDKALSVLDDLGYGLEDIGRVTSLKLSVEGLQSMDFEACFEGLTDLEVNVNRLRDLRGISGLDKLQNVSAKDNEVEEVECLASCTSLRSLRLDCNRLVSLNGVNRLPSLITLSANTNHIIHLPELHCPNLQRLELYHNSISDVPSLSVSTLPSLTHLDLGRNQLQTISGSALSRCSLLQCLVLSQNRLTELPAPLYLPNLRQLWCSGNRLVNLSSWVPRFQENSGSSASVQAHTSEWVFLPMLEKLHLQDNSLQTLDIGAFCTLPRLSSVDLSFNSLESIYALAGLGVGPQPFSLRELQLQDNPISRSVDPTGVHSTAEMKHNLAQLHAWLTRACPGLSVLSHQKFPPEEVSAASSPPGQRSKDTSINNLNGRHGGGWSVQYIRNARRKAQSNTATAAASSTRISFEDAVELQVAAVVQALREQQLQQQQDQQSTITRQEEFIRQYQNGSLQSRKLLSIINTIALEQNSWRTREKFAATGAPTKLSSVSESIDASKVGGAVVPEEAVVQLMQQQIDYLQATAANSSRKGTCESTHSGYCFRDNGLQFISHAVYSDNVPCAIQSLAQSAQRHRQEADVHPVGVDDDDVAMLPKYSDMAADIDQADNDEEGREDDEEGLDQCNSEISQKLGVTVATSMQRLFRGSRTRRLLNQALNNARYWDEELEALGDAGDALRAAGLEDLLQGEELHPHWLLQRAPPPGDLEHMAEADVEVDGAEGDGADDDDIHNTSFKLAGNGTTLAYGDLQRGRAGKANRDENMNMNTNSGFDAERDHAALAWATPPPSSQPMNYSQHRFSREMMHPQVASANASDMQFNGAGLSPRSLTSRPVSCSTDISTMSAFDPGDIHHQHGGGDNSSQVHSVRSNSRSAVAEEWNIADPHLLEVMMKRNKRMMKFATAKDNREKEKDPDVRLQKFLKTAHSQQGTMGQSGSFGGKPKTTRQRSGKSGTVPRAWALGMEGEHEEN